MCKPYRYNNLSYTVADDSDVYFTVEYLSDGNSGLTSVDVPGTLDPEIKNAGKVFIGKGKDLRGEATYVSSNIDNKVSQEDEIRVKYLINNEELVEHHNLKSEAERITVILKITFPRP